MNQWISVKDRLPEATDPVWGYTDYVLVLTTGWEPRMAVERGVRRSNGEWGGWFATARRDSITHWMPLPAPPEAK